jgi:hypothetical protein
MNSKFARFTKPSAKHQETKTTFFTNNSKTDEITGKKNGNFANNINSRNVF